MKDTLNPLLASQREKSGAETYEKYSYQYHWALYRVLNEHDNLKEYAVFIELHEDVVVSDSLDAKNANFEFNQVKTNRGRFTPNKLAHQKKNDKSVLGKLISSGLEKPFTSKITELNLVALNDFALELKNNDLSLSKITLDDLSDGQLEELENEMKKEMGIDALPSNIQFIVPELSEKNFQNDIIASIAKLITNLFPASYSSPIDIYRLLIDEVNRKGTVTYDFTKWDELLRNKALTSTTVTKVLNEFTNIKDEAKIDIEFSNICSEIGLKSIEAKVLKRSFNRYRTLRISNSSVLQNDLTNYFVKEIESIINNGTTDFKDLIEQVKKEIPKNISNVFHSDIEITSAIICEYIMMN
ncbi:DUF4297 domain-containing protein [Persicobacter diffluens]|uniref:CD-NTase associated protein 4-like DNA endonuclease domain-containing protein n=1 Tax=Persicobacter diffluens TaxID=981 RepID=A0AAN4W175_9BACT|nr:hypothetical protein PEDI_37690 [Persicobacter diffluens]